MCLHHTSAMNSQEILCRMALPQLPGIGIATARQLLCAAGGRAAMLFERRNELPELIPGIPKRIIASLDNPGVLRLCEAELSFAEKNHIVCLTSDDEAYPSRLRECDDAPLVLFYRGTADLNKRHIISMVGTRNATDYGKNLCTRFMNELHEILPDALIVSGLAYGIDVCSHRAALDCGMETVGVLAHGLDRIYPPVHRKTAAEMTAQGGLLTEYMSGTSPDRQNFIKRNRIVAGLSDATIVVESAAKGGSLITAEIAESYHRECFAFPGRADDTFSVGCNKLIQSNRAILLQSAEDLVKAMNWDVKTGRPKNVQRQLFVDLTPEEETVVAILGKHPDGLQVNTLVVDCNIAVNRMTTILFELEMKGVIRMLAGGVYKLVG